MPLIRVSGLVKEFRRPRRHTGFLGGVRTLLTREYTVTRAVDGISFDVERGELVGYLGPNGAGKSTTIKMMTGILVPTAGQVEVAGVTPWRDRHRNAKQIGVVFGQRSQLWWDLPLRESFRLIGSLYEVPPARYRANLARFTELLDLGGFLDTPVRQLSLGQRMRGDLAAAMLYDPAILYLDEPTVGLDLVAKERIREFVAELVRDATTTVILTTHDLEDVERLCHRVILIDHGRAMFDGDLATLTAKYTPYREMVVHLAAPIPHTAGFALPGVARVDRQGRTVRLRFDPGQLAATELIAQVTARYPVTDLSVTEPALDAVIREIYAERSVRV